MSTERTNNGEEMQQAHDAEKGHDAEERKVTNFVSGSSDEIRDKRLANLRPWQPGQSGNPSGRPKKRLVDELLAELLEAKDSEEALAVALKMIDKAKSGDVKAAQLIAERTQGKPQQKVELTGKDGGPVDSRIEVVLVRPDGT